VFFLDPLKGQEIFALPLIHNLKYFANSGGLAEIFAVHITEVTAALLHDLAALLTPLNQKLSGVNNIAMPN
jgi:predicted HD phosphohydrolase